MDERDRTRVSRASLKLRLLEQKAADDPMHNAKIRPSCADRGDRLVLRDAWTKGGVRGRFRYEPCHNVCYLTKPKRLQGASVSFPPIVSTRGTFSTSNISVMQQGSTTSTVTGIHTRNCAPGS